MATMSSMLSPPPSGRCSNGILTFFCPTEANLKSLDTFCAEKTNYAVYGKAECQRTKLPLIRLVFKLKKRCSITTVQNMNLLAPLFGLRAVRRFILPFATARARRGARRGEDPG